MYPLMVNYIVYITITYHRKYYYSKQHLSSSIKIKSSPKFVVQLLLFTVFDSNKRISCNMDMQCFIQDNCSLNYIKRKTVSGKYNVHSSLKHLDCDSGNN
jgi:hypothetical protein